MPTKSRLRHTLKVLAKLADLLPADKAEPLLLTDLPRGFHPLIPLIRRQLQAFVRKVSPFFDAIDAYLDGFGDNVPDAGAALGSLAEAAAEAKLMLEGPGRLPNHGSYPTSGGKPSVG